LPWGFSPSIEALAARLGVPSPGPPLEVVRRVNSKAFAHDLASRLGLSPPGSVHATTPALEAALRNFPGETLWVVKRSFGFGGQGHIFGRGPSLPPNGPGWLAKAFAHGDPVVL
jgi:hypothetical protein